MFKAKGSQTTTALRNRIAELKATNDELEMTNTGLNEEKELLQYGNTKLKKECDKLKKDRDTEKIRLENECNKLKKEMDTVRSCMITVSGLIGSGDAASVAKAKTKIADETAHAMVALVTFLKNKSLADQKILPPGWHLHSIHANTYCGLVMAAISNLIPSHWDDVFFWHIIVVPKVQSHYNRQRGETVRKLQRNVIGEVLPILPEK